MDLIIRYAWVALTIIESASVSVRSEACNQGCINLNLSAGGKQLMENLRGIEERRVVLEKMKVTNVNRTPSSNFMRNYKKMTRAKFFVDGTRGHLIKKNLFILV